MLGLLLACAASLGICTVILEDGMPILWAQTASQLTDLPSQNGVVTPNPWNYLHRLSMLRLLIAATDPYMGSMGTNATDSPVWGLPLQLAWMLTSGRFVDPTGATTCGQQTEDPMCISTQSWWGCINYFPSTLPFLSAAKEGFLGAVVEVQMQVPEGADFCTTYADCATRFPDAMNKWDTFYQGLTAAMLSPLPDNEKKDAILGLYWEALTAVTRASAVCINRQSFYSSSEVAFSNSWVNSAEYVAAAHFQSSMANSVPFITPLPSRILQDTDTLPIADLSDEENHTLRTFAWMKSVNDMLFGSVVGMWRGAMCSVATREKGRAMLSDLMLNPRFATQTFLTLIGEIRNSC